MSKIKVLFNMVVAAIIYPFKNQVLKIKIFG